MKYVKLNGNTIQRLSDTEALNYLDEKELNNAGYKEFVPATYDKSKPHKWSYEETDTQIIERVEEIIPEPEDLLKMAKESKLSENDTKAEEYRYSQEFTVTIQGKECVFDTKEKTQNDLNTATNFCLATGGTYDNWVTNNGIKLNLTLEDIAIIGAEFKVKADVYSLWAEYKEAIEQAETIEQLEEIDISYDRVDT